MSLKKGSLINLYILEHDRRNIMASHSCSQVLYSTFRFLKIYKHRTSNFNIILIPRLSSHNVNSVPQVNQTGTAPSTRFWGPTRYQTQYQESQQQHLSPHGAHTGEYLAVGRTLPRHFFLYLPETSLLLTSGTPGSNTEQQMHALFLYIL